MKFDCFHSMRCVVRTGLRAGKKFENRPFNGSEFKIQTLRFAVNIVALANRWIWYLETMHVKMANKSVEMLFAFGWKCSLAGSQNGREVRHQDFSS